MCKKYLDSKEQEKLFMTVEEDLSMYDDDLSDEDGDPFISSEAIKVFAC